MKKQHYGDLLSQIGKSAQVVAVSKKQSASTIRILYDEGHRTFGENYVQELCSKKEQLPPDIEWHFIGHLQTNKVKFIASFIHCIQSVDSTKLLEIINKQAEKYKRSIDVLFQVHIADEPSKYGIPLADFLDFVAEVACKHKFEHVRLRGLMGMSTNTQDTEKVAREFQLLKELFDKTATMITSLPIALHWDTLSMGMSGDYRLAIEKGSNMVRIGSLLFGERM